MWKVFILVEFIGSPENVFARFEPELLPAIGCYATPTDGESWVTRRNQPYPPGGRRVLETAHRTDGDTYNTNPASEDLFIREFACLFISTITLFFRYHGLNSNHSYQVAQAYASSLTISFVCTKLTFSSLKIGDGSVMYL